jgi:FtsP/CotA-like multicopper oxidase with cupredoxin domain
VHGSVLGGLRYWYSVHQHGSTDYDRQAQKGMLIRSRYC